MTAGNPVHSLTARASSHVVAMCPSGHLRPIFVIASPNNLRSSATAIARAFAPISSTPYFSSTPLSWSFIATLSAVWPPIVGSSASGFSRAMISSTYSGVTGSM